MCSRPQIIHTRGPCFLRYTIWNYNFDRTPVCVYIYRRISCKRVSGFMFALRCFNIQLLYMLYIVYKYRARSAVLELFISLVFVNYGLISRIFWWLPCIVQKLFPRVKHEDKNVHYIIIRLTLFVLDKACCSQYYNFLEVVHYNTAKLLFTIFS